MTQDGASIPIVCQHPGCTTKLVMQDWGNGRDGLPIKMPASPFCANCRFHYMDDDDVSGLESKLKRNAEVWGRYSTFDRSQAPRRVIKMIENKEDAGVEIEADEMHAVIQSSGKGVLFQGETGLGKTFTLFCLSEQIIKATGAVPIYVFAPQLRNDLAEAATSDSAREKANLLRKLCNCRVLFLDDLGSANITAAFEEALQLILETRQRMGLLTCVSLQQDAETFISTSSRSPSERRQAIIRRLGEMCVTFKFTSKT